jgi:hypothetical protein
VSETFLDALTARLLEAGRYSTNSEVAPAAILWPDAQREWEPLIASLRARLPVLVLGEYEPESRAGPSYWIRCMVDRTLDDRIPEDETPIVYLPGVSKQDLRAMEEADQLLKPLAELQYRGTLFTQKNGRDWTSRRLSRATMADSASPLRRTTARKRRCWGRGACSLRCRSRRCGGRRRCARTSSTNVFSRTCRGACSNG